jgi:hypothetical protein
VQLVEMDANVSGESGSDDVIAVFEGRIVNRKFKGKMVRKAEAHKGASTFRFQFEGDGEEHELPIPSGRGEKEQGAFEIGVKVTSQIRGRSYGEYESPVPAAIRNLPQARGTAKHRPVVTFIAKKDRPDRFYKAARKFWEPASDWLEERGSLEEIIDFLNANQNKKTADGLDFGGKFGQINVVTHANEEGWAQIPLFSREPLASGVDAEKLQKNLRDSRLRLTSGQLDADTQMVWRGCNVGKSQDFLRASKALFGGKCQVLAPKYIQAYEYFGLQEGDVVHTWEWFQENFYFDLPWKNPRKRRGKWVKPQLPRERELIARFQAKYPGTATDDEWKKLLGARHRRDSRWPRVLPFNITLPSPKNYRKQAIEVLKSEGVYSDYWWKIRKPKKDRGGYLVVARGSQYRVEVRRTYTDAQGDPVVPDLTDSSHYGRA